MSATLRLYVARLTQIDLDTIDLSNLNRQFLFQKQHIQKPKAEVAKASASAFNPEVEIVAHYGNVQAPEFGVSYYSQFDVVLSALDNLATRRYVNRMCVAADVPLVESGTAGFLGQVQPIRAGHTECYDCTAHPTPTTFPVCTIRSTPSTPMHCIVWAKNWLFPYVKFRSPRQLFGEDDESGDAELDQAAQSGENAQELENLRREAHQMRALRAELGKAPREAAEKIFAKVYDVDIRRLLSMDDMWEKRTRPDPLSLDAARADTTVAPQTEVLKDRRTLSLADTAALFLESAVALAKGAQDAPLSFDKDDADALAFVTAASNLRAHVYHIPRQTQFETKQIAGNIIPAIATTNAIVSGLAVVQAMHMLVARWDAMRIVSVARRSNRVFTTFPPAPPNAACGVCSDMYLATDVDPTTTTLQDILAIVRRPTSDGGLAYDDDAEISIADGARILYDLDLDDNLEKTLAQLNVGVGSALSIVDEDAQNVTVQLLLQQGTEAKVHWPHGTPVAVRPRRALPKPASDSESEVEAVDAAAAVAPAAPKRTKRPADAEANGPAKRHAPAGQSEEAAIVLE